MVVDQPRDQNHPLQYPKPTKLVPALQTGRLQLQKLNIGKDLSKIINAAPKATHII
jgi:hypothetical protein